MGHEIMYAGSEEATWHNQPQADMLLKYLGLCSSMAWLSYPRFTCTATVIMAGDVTIKTTPATCNLGTFYLFDLHGPPDICTESQDTK